MFSFSLYRHCLLASAGLAALLGFTNCAFADDGVNLQLPPFYLNEEATGGDQVQAENGNTPILSTDGAIEIVRERFANGGVKVERGVTLDAEGNYVNHGAWRMFATDGKVVAEGQYDMGKRVGVWTRYHARGDSPVLGEFPLNRFKTPFVSTANFTEGVMDGEWLLVDAEEHKCMQVSIKMGQRHGPVITWLPTGKTYRQATYDQGVPVGDVLEVNSKSGELERTASYVAGRKVVSKTAHYDGGRQKKSEAMYLAATTIQKSPDDFWNLRLAEYVSEGQDLRHGPAKAWYENGKQRLEGFYQHDKKSGTFTYWHQNGQVAATGEFKDDQFHATWVWFHENGLKSSIGRYDNGVQLGEWRWWNEDGRLAKNREYDGTEPLSPDTQDAIEIGQAPTDAETFVR